MNIYCSHNVPGCRKTDQEPLRLSVQTKKTYFNKDNQLGGSWLTFLKASSELLLKEFGQIMLVRLHKSADAVMVVCMP